MPTIEEEIAFLKGMKNDYNNESNHERQNHRDLEECRLWFDPSSFGRSPFRRMLESRQHPNTLSLGEMCNEAGYHPCYLSAENDTRGTFQAEFHGMNHALRIEGHRLVLACGSYEPAGYHCAIRYGINEAFQDCISCAVELSRIAYGSRVNRAVERLGVEELLDTNSPQAEIDDEVSREIDRAQTELENLRLERARRSSLRTFMSLAGAGFIDAAEPQRPRQHQWVNGVRFAHCIDQSLSRHVWSVLCHHYPDGIEVHEGRMGNMQHCRACEVQLQVIQNAGVPNDS